MNTRATTRCRRRTRLRPASRWSCWLVLFVAAISLAGDDRRIQLDLSIDPTGTRFTFVVRGQPGTPFTLIWAARRAERVIAGSERMGIPIEHPVFSLLHGGKIDQSGAYDHEFRVSRSVLPAVAWLQAIALDPDPPHRPQAVSELYRYRRGPPATVTRVATAPGFRWDILALVVVAIGVLAARRRPDVRRIIAACVVATGLIVGVAPRLPRIARITTDPARELSAIFPRDFAEAFERAAARLPSGTTLWIPWELQFVQASPTLLTHRMYPRHVVHFHEAAVTAAATTTVYRLAPVTWKAPAGWSREPVFEFESPTYRFDRLSPTP